MTKLLIFARRNTFSKWKYVSQKLSFADEVKIVSCFTSQGGIDFMHLFYKKYYQKYTNKINIEILEESLYKEVIQRCRLLRNCNYYFAIRMINAVWMAFVEVFNSFEPRLSLASCTDFFVVDLMERVGNERGTKFIGLARCPLKHKIMFLSKNEFQVLAKPKIYDMENIINEVADSSFIPTKNSYKNYGISKFLKPKALWTTRRYVFKGLSLIHKDPLNPEYLMNPKPGDDYYFSLKDYINVSKLSNPKWEIEFNDAPFDKRVFIGLQVNPECTVDYWVKDLELAQYPKSLKKIVKCLTNKGFVVILKDHPDMYGTRKYSDLESLQQYPNVVFVPCNISAQYLIYNCKSTFTWTGTIGMQAAMYGRCSVIAKNMYYSTDRDFIEISSIKDIDDLPKRIEEFQLPTDIRQVQERIAHRIASTCVPGTISLLDKDRQGTELLIKSLNMYLPACLPT